MWIAVDIHAFIHISTFFHGSSHRQREYATVTFMNDVMLQPMGERTPMTQSLRDRAQDAIMCCAALAWRIGGNVLFGMTTALALQQVPLPEAAIWTRRCCTSPPALPTGGGAAFPARIRMYGS